MRTNKFSYIHIKNIYEYPKIIHGTFYEAWEFIKNTGLNKMSRNCIHFAIGENNESNVISGMRGSCQLYVEIDAALCVARGIEMYISTNKVVLSPGVNGVILPLFFKRVVDKTGKILMACQYQQVIVPIFKNDKLIEITVIDLNEGKSYYGITNEEIDLNNFSNKFVNLKLNEKSTIVLLDADNYNKFKNYIQENYKSLNHPSLWSECLLLDSNKNVNNVSFDERIKLLHELSIKEPLLFSGANIVKL